MLEKTIHVLYVDDDPGSADLTGTFLGREEDQFTAETATSATDRVEIIDDRSPDSAALEYRTNDAHGVAESNWPRGGESCYIA
jgi:DNA-binding NtrC family response regulator